MYKPKVAPDFYKFPMIIASPAVDRWQSRYLGSVIGLDNLTSPVEEEAKEESRSACSPFSQRTSTPILKRITKPFNNLLDSRRVAPSKNSVTPSPSRRFSTIAENSCGECYKKLSGKTVRLPDTQVRYHWKCLKCNGCTLPFEDTSFFIDPYKRVYHPNCAPSTQVNQSCSRCSHSLTDTYIAIHSAVLHPRCFRCTGCQKILNPASIYIDLDGSFCQHCTNEKLPNDKEFLSKHMKIVPQPQIVAINSPITKPYSPSVSLGNINRCKSPSSNNLLSSPFSSNRQVISSPPVNNGSIKASTLMSSRGRPLPRFGVVRDCPGCSQRIVSVHEEIPGPKAARWHKKCLACDGCSKILDSGATVAEDLETGNLRPWCTTCLLTKKKKLPSSLSQKWNSALTAHV
ncbi:hypothetical protein INT47_002782 [Mucor saturninus]|uniref:LIM zinc-binding domain-containing protein n=1 Tax=Mucor saturninus TaxID=64648 RepID=A0A8H7V2B0_9FUNG|nr:hypothetical protein INT47_002782 [Mucor saturninus]